RETGKNNYRRELITPKVLRQMQTEVAEILGMKRGEDKRISKRERIEPRKYAKMKEEQKKETKALKKDFTEEKEAL
ncbi:mobilization protein, partial [Campylobacter jejuni]|nr:mobilization protein [Campylobacter jejuni]